MTSPALPDSNLWAQSAQQTREAFAYHTAAAVAAMLASSSREALNLGHTEAAAIFAEGAEVWRVWAKRYADRANIDPATGLPKP